MDDRCVKERRAGAIIRNIGGTRCPHVSREALQQRLRRARKRKARINCAGAPVASRSNATSKTAQRNRA